MDSTFFNDFHETLVVLNLLHIPATEVGVLRTLIEEDVVIGSMETVRINIWAGEFRSIPTSAPITKQILEQAYHTGVDYVAFDDAPDLHPNLHVYGAANG